MSEWNINATLRWNLFSSRRHGHPERQTSPIRVKFKYYIARVSSKKYIPELLLPRLWWWAGNSPLDWCCQSSGTKTVITSTLTYDAKSLTPFLYPQLVNWVARASKVKSPYFGYLRLEIFFLLIELWTNSTVLCSGCLICLVWEFLLSMISNVPRTQ
jgi:hypothetical protein